MSFLLKTVYAVLAFFVLVHAGDVAFEAGAGAEGYLGDYRGNVRIWNDCTFPVWVNMVTDPGGKGCTPSDPSPIMPGGEWRRPYGYTETGGASIKIRKTRPTTCAQDNCDSQWRLADDGWTPIEQFEYTVTIDPKDGQRKLFFDHSRVDCGFDDKCQMKAGECPFYEDGIHLIGPCGISRTCHENEAPCNEAYEWPEHHNTRACPVESRDTELYLCRTGPPSDEYPFRIHPLATRDIADDNKWICNANNASASFNGPAHVDPQERGIVHKERWCSIGTDTLVSFNATYDNGAIIATSSYTTKPTPTPQTKLTR